MDRKVIIDELRKERKTYQEIAELLGISKQRVHQLYKDYKPTDDCVLKPILKRDKFRCSVCNSNKNLEVHHIDGVKINNDKINLITLCRKCHKRIEKESKRRLGIKPIKFFKEICPNRRKERIKRLCGYCKKEFEVIPSSNKKYCSAECFHKATTIDLGTEEERHKAQMKRYYTKNKEMLNKKCREYYWKHKNLTLQKMGV